MNDSQPRASQVVTPEWTRREVLRRGADDRQIMKRWNYHVESGMKPEGAVLAVAHELAAASLPDTDFAKLGDITRSTPTTGYGVRFIAHRKHWHLTLNGVDQSDTEPCFNDVNDALDLADSLNAAPSSAPPTQEPVACAECEGSKYLAYDDESHAQPCGHCRATGVEPLRSPASLPASAEQP